MRRLLIASTVLVAALAAAGTALAVYTQHASVAFTVHKAGKSTGLTSSLYSSASSTDQLKSAKTVIMTFPAKTRFNLGTPKVKRCRFTDAQLTSATAPASCPKSSRIGSGSGKVNFGPTETSATQFGVTVKAFVRNASTMILVVNALGSNLVIHAVARQQKLTIGVPQINVGGVPVIVTALKLKVPALGTGRKALLTSGRCIDQRFLISTLLKYSDGTSKKIASTSRCSS